MATWSAECWLGSENGYQKLEVQSNTIHGAEEQFRRIYGAEQVINLREVSSNSSSPLGCFGFISGLFNLVILLVLGSVALALFSPSENTKENNQPIQRSQVRENSFARSITSTLDDIDRN